MKNPIIFSNINPANKYRNSFTGLMIGSIHKIRPWKETVQDIMIREKER